VAGCASLKPLELPPEHTSSPADSKVWNAVGSALAEDWHVLLNDGPTALDWRRLRAIDTASDSIDLQTFLWHLDTAGAMVVDHIIQAADRGVTVRILVDDTFLVFAEHPNIEYRVFNPFKRRSGGFATRQLLNLAEFGRLDHRVAIVGGRNIADDYWNDRWSFPIETLSHRQASAEQLAESRRNPLRGRSSRRQSEEL
jgi:putative cardiolipin synthase